jgi:protein TonB
MSKRFSLSISTVLLVHLVILFGTWQISQTPMIQEEVQKLGNGAIKLAMGSLSISQSAPAVQRKVVRQIPVAPQPKTTSVAPAAPSSASNSTSTGAASDSSGYSSTEGSIYGTARKGLTDVRSLYRAELRAMIEKNKYYPSMSKRLGQTGTVVVAFTLLEDGNITDVKIDQPSRYENLNVSALDAVKKVERFRPIPKEFGEQKMEIKVPVNFKTI